MKDRKKQGKGRAGKDRKEQGNDRKEQGNRKGRVEKGIGKSKGRAEGPAASWNAPAIIQPRTQINAHFGN